MTYRALSCYCGKCGAFMGYIWENENQVEDYCYNCMTTQTHVLTFTFEGLKAISHLWLGGRKK